MIRGNWAEATRAKIVAHLEFHGIEWRPSGFGGCLSLAGKWVWALVVASLWFAIGAYLGVVGRVRVLSVPQRCLAVFFADGKQPGVRGME